MGVSKIDQYSFIPKYNIERKLNLLHPMEKRKILNNTFQLLKITDITLYKLRYCAYGAEASVLFETMITIADYLGCTVDSLINRTRQPMKENRNAIGSYRTGYTIGNKN